VPKVVGTQRRRQIRPPGGRLKLTVQELPLAQRPAQRRGEHEILGAVGPPGEVIGQQLDQEPRQPYRAALVGLGRPPHERTVYLGRRLDHLAAAAEQVEALGLERDHLTEAEACVGQDVDEHAVVRPDGISELLDLGGVQEQHLALDPLGQPHSGGRVAGQPATLDRRGEYLGKHLMSVADSRWRQATLDRTGDPLANGESVDAGEGRRAKVGENLIVEQHPVGSPGARLGPSQQPNGEVLASQEPLTSQANTTNGTNTRPGQDALPLHPDPGRSP